MRLLTERKATDIPVLAGGIIPETDVDALKKIGVNAVFTSANSLAEITQYVQKISRKN
jgi:methylmalonyl-CoA mutase C-terminal domain/subunit